MSVFVFSLWVFRVLSTVGSREKVLMHFLYKVHLLVLKLSYGSVVNEMILVCSLSDFFFLSSFEN